MLEPNSRKRLTISQIKVHVWIYSIDINEFQDPDDDWIKQTITRIAAQLSTTVDDCHEQCRNNYRYSSIGGIFNIKKHLYQMNRFHVMQRSNQDSKFKVKPRY